MYRTEKKIKNNGRCFFAHFYTLVVLTNARHRKKKKLVCCTINTSKNIYVVTVIHRVTYMEITFCGKKFDGYFFQNIFKEPHE